MPSGSFKRWHSTIGVRLSKNLRLALDKKAKKHKMTVSEFIRFVLEELLLK